MIQLTKGTNVLDINLSDFSGAGQDVVQNGSFNDIGSDLVQNGDFAEIGSELVTNGDFSAVPLIGGELVTDGNFPTPNVNWGLLHFTIANNKLHCISDGTYSYAYQNGVFVAGKTYLITFDITDWTLGTIRVRPSTNVPYQTASANGSYSFLYVADHHQLIIEREVGACDMFLENISVKEATNLVTNPNFTDTGSELITNGDFAVSGTLTSTSWSLGWRAGDNGLSISDGALNLVNDGSGFVGRAYATNGVDSYNGVIEVGKSYSLTYEVTENIDAATLYYYAGSFVSIAKDVNVHTVEFTATTDFFLLRNGSSNTTIKIDNVSVKELGEDWTAYTSGTSTVEYNSTGANLLIDSAANGGSNVGVYQENIFELGKSYKIVLSMKATASFDAEVVESNLAATENVIGTVSLTTSFQDFTFYYVGTGTFDLFIHRLYNGGGASQTISIQSVVVQELGEGWIDDGTPLKAATFDANGLTITTVNGTGNNNRVSQIDVAHDSKSYKVTYTIYSATLTDSNVLQYYNGTAYVTIPTAITGTPQTFYFTSSSSSGYWNFRIGTYNGSTTDFVTISSISVKEVGQDWTVANTDATHYVEFFGGVGGARYYSLDAGTSALSLQQTAIPVIGYGKSYKLTCTCTFTSGTNIRFYSGSLNVGLLTEGENTLYFVSDNNQSIGFIRNLNALVDVVITNVVVKQLDTNDRWVTFADPDSKSVMKLGQVDLEIDSSGNNCGVYQTGLIKPNKLYIITINMKATAAINVEIAASLGTAVSAVIGTETLTTSYKEYSFEYVTPFAVDHDLQIHRLFGSGADQTISIDYVSMNGVDESQWTNDPTWDPFATSLVFVPTLTDESTNNSKQFTLNTSITDGGWDGRSLHGQVIINEFPTEIPAAGVINLKQPDFLEGFYQVEIRGYLGTFYRVLGKCMAHLERASTEDGYNRFESYNDTVTYKAYEE